MLGTYLTLLWRVHQAYTMTAAQSLQLLYSFPLDNWREEALVVMFQSILNRGSLHLCSAALSERSRLSLHRRIGPWYLVNR